MKGTLARLALTALAAGLGWVVGWVWAVVGTFPPDLDRYPFLAKSFPLPHQVPKYQDGLTFRFAMVHDVVHERFPKHGAAYYRERNRLTRDALALLPADDPGRFPRLDDLAAGLERLGESEAAAELMRKKLAEQSAQGIHGRDLYTTYANLGTFLIHSQFKRALNGDADAVARFREGVEFIHRSVEVNPEAHFGRESWQEAIAEFLLAAIEKPAWLTRFDCLGNRLDTDLESLLNRETNWTITGYGRPVDPAFGQGKVDAEVPAFFQPGVNPAATASWTALAPIRGHITKIGAEPGWEEVGIRSHREPVAFDEPMLGIIGMWRQGGGANPHFALAIGETMLRVGQRYIAWKAFERASRMAEAFWPDPAIQKALREHCRTRQQQIEASLTTRIEKPRRTMTPWEYVTPPPANPEAVVARLRPQFEAELSFGQGYQLAYQEYEAQRIAAGASIDDDHFFDAFHAQRPAIASPSGREELYVRVSPTDIDRYEAERRQALGTFGAGLASILAVVGLRVREILRAKRSVIDTTHGYSIA